MNDFQSNLQTMIEGIANAVIMDHHGGQVVSFNNAEGGIVLLGD